MTDATPAPERWLPVPEYQGLYLASNHGQVRSLPRNTTSGRILKPWRDDNGRWCVKLSKNGVEKTLYVHRLVAGAFIGPKPDGLETRHLDDDPDNNRADNLAYGTSAENKADMLRNHGHYKNAITECPQNHEYTPENTIIGPNGRECRRCRNDRSRERDRALAVPGAGKPCTEEGCDLGQVGQGLCRKHYDKQWKADNPEAVKAIQQRNNARRVPSGPPCSEPGCETPSSAKGMCKKHYLREYSRTHPRVRKPRPSSDAA
jgi:hypothetical protein